jgi:hypothetical protein
VPSAWTCTRAISFDNDLTRPHDAPPTTGWAMAVRINARGGNEDAIAFGDDGRGTANDEPL